MQPSQTTIKRLFAESGNRCAFPGCTTRLVDPESGTVVGEVCHIKGAKPNAARHDVAQSEEERHHSDNLIILCNVHHKVVDDNEAAYPVEMLKRLKVEHAARTACGVPLDPMTVDRFVRAVVNGPVHGSVINSTGQSGGQTAHQITNYYGPPANEEAVLIEGTLAWDAKKSRFGCVGLEVMVVCRSTRPAKIRSAHLYVMGVSILEQLQQGFATDFGHVPVEGSRETLVADLVPISPRNAPEGYVLNRDDVCRFFYPLPVPSTMLAIDAKPEDVAITVEFFDTSERTLIEGDAIQGHLKGIMEMYREKAGQFNGTVNFSVRTLVSKLPNADAAGKVNPNPISFKSERAEESAT